MSTSLVSSLPRPNQHESGAGSAFPQPQSHQSSTSPSAVFPFKLHQLLKDAAEEGNHEIVSWQPKGLSFKVYDKVSFASDIMPKYFGSSKYRSFQKNLNLWGFKTSLSTKSRGECSHSLFVRDMPSLCNGMKRFVKSKERQQKIQVACQAGPPSKASHVTPQDHPHVATGNASIGDDSTVSTKEKHDDLLFLDLQGKDPRRRPSLPTRGAAASTLAMLTGSDVTMGTTIHRDKATRMNLASSSLLHIDPINGGLGLFVGVNPVSGAPAIDLQRNLLQQGTSMGAAATKMVLTGLEAEYQQRRTNQIFGRSSSSPETSTRTIAHAPGALLAGGEQWGWSTTANQDQYQSPAPTLVLAAHRRHSNVAANDFAGVAPATIVNKPSDEEDHYDRLLSELLGVLTQKQDNIQEEINALHALQKQQPRKTHAASVLSSAHHPPTSNGMTAKLSTSAWPYQKLNHTIFDEVLAATTPTAAVGDISAVASILLQKQREIAAEKVRLLLAQGVPNSTRSNIE